MCILMWWCCRMRKFLLNVTLGLSIGAGALFASALPALAVSPLKIDVAYNHLDITTGFTGGDIVVYGKRNWRGEIALVIKGPERDVIVRRKENILGAWINKSWVRFKSVPEYYDFSTSVSDYKSFEKYGIGVDAISFVATNSEKKIDRYKDAYLAQQRARRFYASEPSNMEFLDPHFFKTRFQVPANVPKGVYTVTAYLIDQGRIAYQEEVQVNVAQVGFNSHVNKFSQNNGFSYAAVCLFIALLSGWLSNKVARRSA